MSSIYDAIIYFPKYPEPNHRDFDTLEEAVEAKRAWERKTKADMAMCCPRCNSIQKANHTELTTYLKSDNDPYNPRDNVTRRTYVCYECDKPISLGSDVAIDAFLKNHNIYETTYII